MSSTDQADWKTEVASTAPHETPARTYRRIARRVLNESEGLTPLRLTLLTSYTATFWDDFLCVEFARRGFAVEVLRGEFGEFETFLARQRRESDDSRALEALVLHMRPSDVRPDATARFYGEAGMAEETFADVHDRLENCIELFRAYNDASPVLLGTHDTPWPGPLGVLDATDPGALTHVTTAANRDLARLAAATDGVFTWDYAGLVATHGAATWADPRLLALARTPVAEGNLGHLASHLASTYRAVTTPSHKCLVLDLDHTLWGGAVGDDGLEGIVLGDDFPGSAYKHLQRVALGLRDRGVILAVSSKNDEDVALEAMEKHPEMLIRPEHLGRIRDRLGPEK